MENNFLHNTCIVLRIYYYIESNIVNDPKSQGNSDDIS